MVTRTQAAILFELGQPLRVVDIDLPELKPGQVLVDLAYSGVCHTQLSEARGKRGADPFLPHAMGHEGAGIVLEIGQGVRKVKPGDHVVLSWIKGRGADVPSTVYRSNGQKINSGAVCTFMRHAITCENRLVAIPEVMPLRTAALLGCVVPTGCGVIINTAKVQKGQSVAVFGTGGVGLCAILAAVRNGAYPIVAVDILDYKLSHARQAGATHLVNASRQNALAEILKITNGQGVDYSIESAGTPRAMESAFKAVRNGGGLCIIAGNAPAGETITLNPFDLIKGKRIVGSWGGETDPERDIPLYAESYLDGRLKLDQLITNEYTLEDTNQALDSLEQGKCLRPIINLTQE